MNISAPFVHRPVATILLTAAVTLAGIAAFNFMPVSPIPQVDFPTISVSASQPGASPEIMASSVAAPLEKQFGRIASVTEMTSVSNISSTQITLQFDLNRNIDGAARDVQAAINAARSNLPSNLPANPTYRKYNPADTPIIILSLTSNVYDLGVLYDAANSIIAQRASQIRGVGQVNVSGSSPPAVRVDVNPRQLNGFGLNVQNVASILSAQNANQPKGQLSNSETTADILANDQLLKADDYKPLIVGYHNGATIKLSDVADVTDSVQNIRSAGYVNEKPAVTVMVYRQAGANIIETVDRVREALPSLQASIPAGMKLVTIIDRTSTIRTSVNEVERALIISIILVILVVFLFLRSIRATLVPAVVVPVSLIGTFGVMYLCNFSIDNLSLMALTISTGFVVDDAIVVVENISRYLEQGMSPMQATLKGAKEIGFTVLSVSISLVAVFIPILLMGGIIGRLFREFAVTLSVAIVVSLIVSLTMTPMMCARLLRHVEEKSHGWAYRTSEKVFEWLLGGYERSLTWTMRHPLIILGILLITISVNGFLFYEVPKGFFPQQDNGVIIGGIVGSEDMSFQAMNAIMQKFVAIIKSDPAIDNVTASTGGVGFGGGGSANQANLFIGLKPYEERKIDASLVINRLRPKLISVPGATAFMRAGQDLRIGGRSSNALYQYTLQSDNVQDLVTWGPTLLEQMKRVPGLTDVNSDQQNSGLQASLLYDRQTAARFGVAVQSIDNTLYDEFGQAPVSTMYTPLNQYYVILEAAPQFWQSPKSLNGVYVQGINGNEIPLDAITKYQAKTAPLAVNHQGQFPSVTVSFNLAPGVALSEVASSIAQMEQKLGMPDTIHGMFSGTLQAFQASLETQPQLIIMALLAVYIVLGILYESLIHPVTILSTLPSAGIGAVLALMLFHTDLSVIAMIGILLLIGIVKKNAILMIDFAIEAERAGGITSRDAIFQACLLRFRPILMTTMAALFGALPLALGTGAGAELRRPLGITIVGGLIVSQLLTLYTTPVVYLYMDRLQPRKQSKMQDLYSYDEESIVIPEMVKDASRKLESVL